MFEPNAQPLVADQPIDQPVITHTPYPLRRLSFSASVECRLSDADFAALKERLEQDAIQLLESIPDPDGAIEIQASSVTEVRL